MPTKRRSSVRPLPAVRPPPSVGPPPSDARPKNRLLAALPAADFSRLSPLLHIVAIHRKQLLHKKGEPFDAVYFLNGGVASITTALSDGTSVEAATIGNEGMLGIEAFLGPNPVAPGDTMIQVPNTNAERMNVGDFRREIAEQGALHDLLGRYTQVLIAQMMQCPRRATRYIKCINGAPVGY